MSTQETVPSVDPVPSAGSRATSIALGVVGGLVIIGLVWFFLFAPGADTTLDGAVDVGTAAVDGPDDVTELSLEAAEADDFEMLPVVTHDVYLARDPFEPVIEPEAVQGGGDGVAPPDGDPSLGDDPPPTGEQPPGEGLPPTWGEPPTNGAPLSGTCTGQEELVCDGQVVTLQAITVRDGERVAVVQVDTAIYEVRHGEIFAGHYRIVEFISDSAVRLQYGEFVQELSVGASSLK